MNYIFQFLKEFEILYKQERLYNLNSRYSVNKQKYSEDYYNEKKQIMKIKKFSKIGKIILNLYY